jgi:hypothetical protein
MSIKQKKAATGSDYSIQEHQILLLNFCRNLEQESQELMNIFESILRKSL